MVETINRREHSLAYRNIPAAASTETETERDSSGVIIMIIKNKKKKMGAYI